MLDFTNTPERRKKAAQTRNRKALMLVGIAILIPVAASALGIDGFTLLARG